MLQGLILLLIVASVPLAGGRLRRLGEVRLCLPGLALAALAIQIVIISVVPDGPEALYSAVHVGSYLLVGAFVVLNRRLPGLWLIALGGALNFIAIVANGGVMPASAAAVEAAGLADAGTEFANSGPVADPKLLFLGDVFASPGFLPIRNVYSVGDVLLSLGAAVAMHRICRSRLVPRRWREEDGPAEASFAAAGPPRRSAPMR